MSQVSPYNQVAKENICYNANKMAIVFIKKTIYTFVLLIFTFVSLSAKSQNQKIDSLNNLLLEHVNEDTIRVNLLTNISNELFREDMERGFVYNKEAFNLAQMLDFPKGIYASLRYKGAYYDAKGDYAKALVYFKQSLEIAQEAAYLPEAAQVYLKIGYAHEKQGDYLLAIDNYEESLLLYEELNDKKEIGDCLNYIGIVLKNLGNYPRALEYQQRALLIAEELGVDVGIAICLNNIGVIYNMQEDNSQSLLCYDRALSICKDINNERGISYILNNIGNVYKGMSKDSAALNYYRKSVVIKEKLGDEKGMANCYSNIGVIYSNQGNFLQSIFYHNKALVIREVVGDKQDICESYENIGRTYYREKNYKQALDYTNRSLKIANEFSLLSNKRNIHLQLSKIYSTQKKYDLAYEHQLLFQQLNDSIFNEENSKEIAGLQYKYEYEKEKQASKLKQQKKDAVFAEEMKLQKAIRNGFVIGSFVLIGFILLILNGFVQKRKANKFLAQQKQQIEEKNKELQKKNEEIQIYSKELEEANNTKDKFYSIVAHDLRSPFSSMLGLSGFLVNEYDDYNEEERKQFISIINKGLNNTYSLLEDLLMWTSTKTGKSIFSPMEINLKYLVDGVVGLLGQIAGKKEIIIKNKIPENFTLNADRNMLATVIRNLTSNAIKFTNSGGEIIIDAQLLDKEKTNSYTQIFVQDNGVGIAQKEQLDLFNIAKNVSTSGTENEMGTGLGLLICKEFVEKHGGRIWVESTIKTKTQGSIFYFTIPQKSH